ncbi:hypothetical protein [Rhizobium sp. TRM95796]|uniref:hypothetical protein n=1 Tax=Rhizobium sp. TRM95796 TaxID=2979862 RepID=UPI0021E753FD|nr:hypothetical protein [Rhizobium sp. TRM95796]MCV3764488.1 hypothetical protein [Rhizobium sp. TRM95796]
MSTAQKDIEGRDETASVKDKSKKGPAEGPHARQDLTDHEKTPGSGALVDKDGVGSDADGGVG